MIKLLSLKLSAWFRALLHAIYLYLFLLCKDINRQNIWPEAVWVRQPLLKSPDGNQSDFNCMRVDKDPWPDVCHSRGHPWVRFWRGEQTASEADVEPHSSHPQCCSHSSQGSCSEVWVLGMAPAPGWPHCPGSCTGTALCCQHTGRVIAVLPCPHVSPGICRRGQGLWFVGAQGLPGGFWSQTAPAHSQWPFTATWHLHTTRTFGVYLSKSVIGQCLNNSICILVPILFLLQFWSQPEKERDNSWCSINLCFSSWGCEPSCLLPEGNFSAVKSWLSHLIQSYVLLPREWVSDSSKFFWMNG